MLSSTSGCNTTIKTCSSEGIESSMLSVKKVFTLAILIMVVSCLYNQWDVHIVEVNLATTCC